MQNYEIFSNFAAIMNYNQYTTEAVELLQQLISTPSVSRDEAAAADILADFIEDCALPCQRIGNNLLVHGECVDVYRKVIQDDVMPPVGRKGNWVQPFKDIDDISRFIEAQFQDVERIKKRIYGK